MLLTVAPTSSFEHWFFIGTGFSPEPRNTYFLSTLFDGESLLKAADSRNLCFESLWGEYQKSSGLHPSSLLLP